MIWPFRKKQPVERRASGSGFTAEIMAARESYISGRRGLAELTATAQSCISMWESGLSIADVDGTDLINPAVLALIGRSLALRGEALFYLTDTALIPASDWEVSTRFGVPKAYRLSISEAGGGQTVTALAAEVVHIRIGVDVAAPWIGTAPLRRSTLTAGMLHAVESALSDVFDNAPLGSQIVPFPESPDVDLNKIGADFRGRRGRVLLRESVNVQAAGGPSPSADWKPSDMSPNLERSQTKETLDSAREAILSAFGVLPGLFNASTTGPLVREAQRHLAQWTLQPVAVALAAEASEKLATPVKIDCMRPLQAFDAGGRSRALTAIVQAMAQAKEAGVDPSAALDLVDWGNE
ncbi:MAG: phage portal protein [Roseitalea porphyridii]|jgi:phage portal protein BeeE|uniref:phage portal protein n=1 Tax=Roseitalea porphyridii TaxID=1852022 RepID=UPI0032EFDE9D